MCCHGSQWMNVCAKAKTKVNKMVLQWKLTTEAQLTWSLPPSSGVSSKRGEEFSISKVCTREGNLLSWCLHPALSKCGKMTSKSVTQPEPCDQWSPGILQVWERHKQIQPLSFLSLSPILIYPFEFCIFSFLVPKNLHLPKAHQCQPEHATIICLASGQPTPSLVEATHFTLITTFFLPLVHMMLINVHLKLLQVKLHGVILGILVTKSFKRRRDISVIQCFIVDIFKYILSREEKIRKLPTFSFRLLTHGQLSLSPFQRHHIIQLINISRYVLKG